jgi:hypothetical protein
MHGYMEKLDKHNGVAKGVGRGHGPPYGLQISIENSILIKVLEKLVLLAPLNDEKIISWLRYWISIHTHIMNNSAHRLQNIYSAIHK